MKMHLVALAAAAGSPNVLQHDVTWVPIEMSKERTAYFSPDLGRMVASPPRGADVAPLVSMLQTKEATHLKEAPVAMLQTKAKARAHDDDQPESAGMDTYVMEAPTPDTVAVQQTVEAATINEVTVESDRKACYPHCTWNCTQPVCNQDCAPDCEQPRCQTRCPRPDYSQCHIDCNTPHCSVFCPKDVCKAAPGEKCSSPKCSTQCARAVCHLNCKNILPCQNVCQPPRCTWNCRNPRSCPKPECRLVCEKPLGCANNYELPPLSPALTVEKNFQADRARWVVYKWSQCQVKCGKSIQTRKVVCSTGEDFGCAFAPKPATQQECEDYTGCNKFITAEWGVCSNKCGKGTRSRAVTCSNKDVHECLDPKPAEAEPCDDVGPHCERCQVQLFGGPEFDGWNVTLPQGSFNTDDLIARGVKCEETSSVRVLGTCCEASLFQYGDFNRRNKGWHLKLVEGDYTADQLSERGADDNDLSSLKVHHRPRCGNGKTDHMFRPPKEGVEGEQLEEEDKATQTDGDPFAGIAASSTADDDERPRRQRGGVSTTSTTTKAPEADPYPWWFWLIIALLLIGVVGAIALAARGRQNRL
mmetsp:Transcript_27738/g.59024  ORF Transcript_27738/g.59024 Transcript_27738/m.59024 type:complete len:586 (+) Transcript_27738:97-1854(+)